MGIKVAINGFGRIGRLLLRSIIERNREEKAFDVTAVNDLAPAKTLAHLFKYDSVFGSPRFEVNATDGALIADNIEIPVTNVKNLADLPWGKLGVDIVFEATGIFANGADCKKHLDAGAGRVILTAPGKGEIDITTVMGVNHTDIKPEHKVISNASCTTNCLAVTVKVLQDNFGIEKAQMTTVHAVTNDQRTADQIHKDPRRARAALSNIIPTTTGAAKAIGLVCPELAGKIDGMAVRVPVVDGSIVDLSCILKKEITVETVNGAFKKASDDNLRGFLEYTEDPIVSSDIIGNRNSAIFDSLSTLVTGGNMVKVLSWYDNEMGYSNRCIDLCYYLANGKLPEACNM